MGNAWVEVPRPAREKARERVLTEAELVAVWRAVEAMPHPWNGMVKLLMLTGQRRGEVAGMRWDELDLDAAEWRLPGTRTKNGRAHVIPLSPVAVEVLRAVPRLQGAALVFENSKGTAPTGFGKVQERLAKATAEATGGTERWVLHDLRRTAATGLQRLGVRLEVTEAVLNHVSGSRAGIVGVYQKHTWREEARLALESWGAQLQDLVYGHTMPAKVSHLAATRRRLAGAAA